jgi:hypothetical protein
LRLEFELRLKNKFGNLVDEAADVEIEKLNTIFKEELPAISLDICGKRSKKKEPWLNEEVLKLAKIKEDLFNKWQSSGGARADRAYSLYQKANKACIKATRRAKILFWEAKGQVVEDEARCNNTRAVYQTIKSMGNSQSGQCERLRDADGNLIRTKQGRMKRRKEYFEKLLNAGEELEEEVLEDLKKKPRETDENEPPPHIDEVRAAIKKLKNHKAAGVDGIHAEMVKAGGETMVKLLHKMLEKIWILEIVPDDWMKAIVIPLVKKGDATLCENWRGISLLSVLSKVYTNVILSRLVIATDSKNSEIQAGFRRGRGCSDQIFVMRRLMEQTRRDGKPLYLCFVDLKAAYDTVNRSALWEVLLEYGISDKLCRMIKCLYKATEAAIKCEGEISDWFEVRTGLRQGCLLSPALFNIYMDFVVRLAIGDMEEYGVKIKYRMPDGRIRDGTLVQGEERLLALLYADDLVVICESEEGLSECMLRLERFTQRWGLTISVKKTKKLTTNDENSEQVPIVIRGERVEKVSEFQYLGSMLTENGSSVKDINRRISLGAFKFNELQKPVWSQRNISLRTKIQIYKATVSAIVLYGAESWTCSENEYSRLNAFNTRRLRSILGKKASEIHNKELYKITGMPSYEDLIRKYRLRWAGHVRRLNDCRIPKKLMFGQVVRTGKGKTGRPKREWTDCLKQDLEKVGIPLGTWIQNSKDRLKWRKSISSLTPN